MSERVSTVSWRDCLVVASVALIACLALSWVPSVWYDEAATIVSTTRDWGDLLRMLGTVDLVHGIYYSLMHLWFGLVGYTPFTLRLPSAVFAALAVFATVRFVGSAASRRVAILTGIVLIALPRFTLAGVEGRSYSLTILLGVLMTIAFARALTPPTRRRWPQPWDLYALVSVIGMLVFLHLALLVVAHAVTLLWLRVRGRLAPGILTGFVLRGVVVVVVMLPFVVAAAAQVSQLNWIPAPGESTFGAVLVTEFFPANIPLAVLGWAMAVAGAVLLLRRPDAAATAALTITTLVVPLALLLLFSLTVQPIFAPRYVTFATPALALLIAVGIDAIPRRVLRYVAVALVVALAVPSWLAQRQPIGKGSDAAAVASYVESVEARHPGDTVGIVWGDLARFPLGTARVVEYGYPGPFAAIADLTLAQSAAAAGTLWETTHPLTPADLDGVDSVWVIASSLDSRFADLRVLSTQGFRPVDRHSFYQLDAVRLVRGNAH